MGRQAGPALKLNTRPYGCPVLHTATCSGRVEEQLRVDGSSPDIYHASWDESLDEQAAKIG
jgi:hypothetical protein